MLQRGALLCLLFAGAAAQAEEVRVVSPRPDAVSITIYRDLFALITETRTVDLPEGPVTLVFDGVVETLIPQSALIADIRRRVFESNFDFDRLTRASLLRKSIGKGVTLWRTDRATGKVRQVEATLIAANVNGVIFRTADGSEALQCSGVPERLSFDELPGDLQTTPRLSIHLAAGAPGQRQVRISYLAHGLAWSADYLAHLDGERMDFAGWITLRNLTNAGFRDAEVQLVAGKLNLLDAEEYRGTSRFGSTEWMSTDENLDIHRAMELENMTEELEGEPPDVEYFGGCYPLGIAQVDAITAEDIGKFPAANEAEPLQRIGSGVGEELEEVLVTGFRASMAVREKLADYQLYRLPARTDLNARQVKQVAFLHKPAVRVERFYALRLAGDEDYPDEVGNLMPLNITVGWRNRESEGLGEPLPAGTVRFFENEEGRSLFAGDAKLSDNPVDGRAELTIGRAVDLGIAIDDSAIDYDHVRPGLLSLLTHRVYLPLGLRIINAKPRPVLVEIRQGPMDEAEEFRVVGASLAPQRKAGDYMWRFTVPANGEQALAYKVSGRISEYE